MGASRMRSSAIGAVLLAAMLAGCASGGLAPDPDETEPGSAASPTASPSAPAASAPTSEPAPSAEPEPEPEAEPWVDYVSPDGAIAFSMPASWSVKEWAGGASVTLVTPDGYDAVDLAATSSSSATPYLSPCDDPSVPAYGFEVVGSEPIAPLAWDAIGTASAPLELVTLRLDDGFVGVGILEAHRVAAGCIDHAVPVDGGGIRVTTPWATDAEGLIYDRYPEIGGLLGTPEHRVIVEVLRTLQVHSLSTPPV